MPTQITRRLAMMAAAVMLTVGLASCDAASSSPASSADATVAAATPSASPTASPIDIAEAFATKVRGSLTFSAELSGYVRVGDVEGEMSGELQAVGGDVHNLTVITFPGLPPQETETISVDGKSYKRTPQGYWLQSEGGAGGTGTDPVSMALANADDLEVVGTEEHDGVTLHRIESNDPPDIALATLGITDPTVTDFDAEVAFLAEDDGTPAGIVFTASWTQGPAEAPVPAEFELRYMTVDTVGEIEAPDDPWVLYRSAELGYQMAYPADWDVSFEPATAEIPEGDFYIGPVDGEVDVFRYTDVGGALANEWFRGSVDLLTQSYGTAPEVLATLSLANGLEAQILAGHYADETQNVFYQQGVVFGGDVAWDLYWYSSPGNETEDQALFLQFVSSFERPTE
jgi:hypothetical protein